MAYIINSDCMVCGTCSDTCPANAISMGEDTFEIDQNECVECGTCVDVCPLGAIVPSDEFSMRSNSSELKD